MDSSEITIIGTTNGINFSQGQKFYNGIFRQIENGEINLYPDTYDFDLFFELLHSLRGYVLFAPGSIHGKIESELKKSKMLPSLLKERKLKIGYIKLKGVYAIKPVIVFKPEKYISKSKKVA